MQLDGNEISSDTVRRLQAIRDLLESAANIWAKVPGAEQNAINDLQSDYSLGKCLYWGREAVEGAQLRLLHQAMIESGASSGPDALTLMLNNEAGTPLLARLVMDGDGYGEWDQDTGRWARTHGPGPATRPLVEFYDRRFPHTPFGQFTGHRYFVDTLLRSHPYGAALTLTKSGADRTWHIDADCRERVELWLREHPILRALQEQQAQTRPSRERG
ncbi:MAG TPA: hypothetical protein VN259_17255 [Xanthomonadales bacterium]|nr:hypothetical protein [Xanthomonadales bacterium]